MYILVIGRMHLGPVALYCHGLVMKQACMSTGSFQLMNVRVTSADSTLAPAGTYCSRPWNLSKSLRQKQQGGTSIAVRPLH